jgi:putative ABC transport system substrate-binding protein
MRRRALLSLGIIGGVFASPLGVTAQRPTEIYRIGFLRNGEPPSTFLDAFRAGLRDHGLIDGSNISIEFALAETVERLPEAAAELVGRKVDVILASGTPPVAAAKSATATIPIVFVASIDPIATGTVASLAHPGGNITGFTGIHADLMGKRVELLKEIIPGLSSLAVIAQARNPGNREYIQQAGVAAHVLGIELQNVEVHDSKDFERAFREARRADAGIQLDDVLFTSYRRELAQLAVNNRLPVIYGFREFVGAGGLIAYGSDLPDQYRQAATYVDKILKGAKPADLPVQQPTKFELVINRKTAKALGLNVPQSLLARADEVIE